MRTTWKFFIAGVLVLSSLLPVVVSAAAYYVRPAGACPNHGNGTASTCAASAGAPGAWITFAAKGALAPGDTLCLVGTFNEILILDDNGIESQYVTINGSCGLPFEGKIDGQNTLANLITFRQSFPYLLYNHINGIELTGSTGPAIYHYSFAGVGYNRVTGNNIHHVGVAMAIHSPCAELVAYNTIDHVGDDAIVILDQPAGEGCPILVLGNTISNVSEATESGDDIEVQTNMMHHVTIRGNTLTHNTPWKQAIIAGANATAGTVLIEDNDIDGAGVGQIGISINQGLDVVVRGNRVKNFTVACLQGYDLNPFTGATALKFSGNILTDCNRSVKFSGTGTQTYEVYNNTMVRAGVCIEAFGHGVIAKNNICADYTAAAFALGSGVDGYTGNYNVFKAEGDNFLQKSFGSPQGNYHTLPEWQAAQGQDLNSFVADPLFTSATNFVLSPSSTLRRAGESIGSLCWDARGRVCADNPDVGGVQSYDANDVNVRF